MAVQTFNPTDLSQSAMNWAVAQRIVGPFAPHAQVTPNLTLALDPGFLLSGTTLTEVNAQNVGPFAPPSSGFRIDRVVIDRSTGAASIVTGAANSLTPPAIPSGKLPVARVMLQATTDAITNAVIVDERALSDLTPQTGNSVVCRATMNGVDQNLPASTITVVNLSAAPINLGGAFDTTAHRFQPTLAGYYLLQAKLVYLNSGAATSSTYVYFYLNGASYSYLGLPCAAGAGSNLTITDTIYLNGTTDYIDVRGSWTNSSSVSLLGATGVTWFNAAKVG